MNRRGCPSALGQLRFSGAFVYALSIALLACAGDQSARDTPASGGPPPAGRVEAVDDAGRLVRLPGPAQRVISLLPATTETIDSLGGLTRLVARTDYDNEPRYAHLPSVGGGLTPNLEVVASLRPDLVVAWEEAGTARIRPRLEALGIPVFAVRTEDTTAIFANVTRLGHLLGMDPKADSLAATLRHELAAVRASVTGRQSPAVLYMISVDDPPIAAGPNVFIGQMLEVAGGRNVFSDVTAPSPQVSLEEILRRRPEVVLIPATRDSAAVFARLHATAGWRELLQDRETRFHVVDPDLLERPGPAIAAGARLLRDLIHPGVRGDQ